MTKLKRFFRHLHFSTLGIAVLCAALGLAILLWRGQAMNVLCYGFGIVLILSGILQLAAYLLGERSGTLRKLLIVSGVVSAVAGVWILLSPDKVLKLIGVVLGIVLIYHGIMDVRYGLQIRKCKGRGTVPVVIFGLFTVALGVLVLVNPFEAEKLLLIFMGIGFLFDGATDIYTVITLADAEQKFELLSGAAPVVELDSSAAELVEISDTDGEK